jgi:ribonuclease P protein subunit RPR2
MAFMQAGRGRRGVRTKEMISIASERIDKLFSLAEQSVKAGEFVHANRYASLAWKIATRYNVRLPKKHSINFCRGCRSYLVSGRNCHVRLNRGIRHIQCGTCGRERRIPYVTKRKLATLVTQA